MTSEFFTILRCLREVQERTGIQAYLVGGPVRDLFLGSLEDSPDLDFALEGELSRYVEAVQENLGGTIERFDQFHTATLKNIPGMKIFPELDFARVRTEKYLSPGVLPEVRPANTILEDLGRRDFSVNAMALPVGEILETNSLTTRPSEILEEAVLDPRGGKKDLSQRQIRILHDKSFLDDPTRIFRGCRYAARLGGVFEEDTASAAIKAVAEGALSTISQDRKWNEMKKIFIDLFPSKAITFLENFEVFKSYPIIVEESIDDVMKALQRIQMFRDRFLPEELVKISRAILHFFHPEQEEFIKMIGSGRKLQNELRQMNNDRQSQSTERTSTLYALAIEKNPEKLIVLRKQCEELFW